MERFDGEELQEVKEFKYFASTFLGSDEMEVEVSHRLKKGIRMMGCLRSSKGLSMNVKGC